MGAGLQHSVMPMAIIRHHAGNVEVSTFALMADKGQHAKSAVVAASALMADKGQHAKSAVVAESALTAKSRQDAKSAVVAASALTAKSRQDAKSAVVAASALTAEYGIDAKTVAEQAYAPITRNDTNANYANHPSPVPAPTLNPPKTPPSSSPTGSPKLPSSSNPTKFPTTLPSSSPTGPPHGTTARTAKSRWTPPTTPCPATSACKNHRHAVARPAVEAEQMLHPGRRGQETRHAHFAHTVTKLHIHAWDAIWTGEGLPYTVMPTADQRQNVRNVGVSTFALMADKRKHARNVEVQAFALMADTGGPVGNVEVKVFAFMANKRHFAKCRGVGGIASALTAELNTTAKTANQPSPVPAPSPTLTPPKTQPSSSPTGAPRGTTARSAKSRWTPRAGPCTATSASGILNPRNPGAARTAMPRWTPHAIPSPCSATSASRSHHLTLTHPTRKCPTTSSSRRARRARVTRRQTSLRKSQPTSWDFSPLMSHISLWCHPPLTPLSSPIHTPPPSE